MEGMGSTKGWDRDPERNRIAYVEKRDFPWKRLDEGEALVKEQLAKINLI